MKVGLMVIAGEPARMPEQELQAFLRTVAARQSTRYTATEQ